MIELPIPTEEEEQAAIFEWANLQRGAWPELDLLYHVPNEGKRSTATGARMRRAGLKKGVPDMCLPVARGGFHGLYIELKRRSGGVLSENQKKWLEALRAQGYKAVRCNGADEVIITIRAYLKA